MYSYRSATSNARSPFIRGHWHSLGSPTASILTARMARWGIPISRASAEVDAAYAAAIAAGASDNGKPSARLYYDPRYYAGNVFDPDGYSLEFVYKSWQHQKP